MKQELQRKLNELIDKRTDAKSNIKEIQEHIADYGYSDDMVELLIKYRCLVVDIDWAIMMVQRDIEVCIKSIEYQAKYN
tara:strand:+ start:3296 stop:3532 length:237 start_codon:yes stop_codon:yes gene_type:complete